jgi:phosphohistidine swiveling domain-containing protein
MLWVGFDPTTPVFERAKTVHALDRAATVIGEENNLTSFM